MSDDTILPFHIESHQSLVQRGGGASAPGRALDAIVVPTIKPRSLQTAFDLANQLECALVILTSTAEQAAEVRSLCQPGDGTMLVTCVPDYLDGDYLKFLTAVHPETEIVRSCHYDIARKRNVGMLLARLCGWRVVLYLDDDIRDLTADAVRDAASLTQFAAVGFTINEYPDNSVVCHAHRLAGGNQATFPGGGALVIDVLKCDSLFPPVYNEDWLFLFDIVHDRSIAVAGEALQLKYEPFAHPRRAGSEEFGDFIAEGLYRLLHADLGVLEATHDYWRAALERRFLLIEDVAARVLQQESESHVAGLALMSLTAARKRLSLVSALSCVSFVRAWQADLESWRHKLSTLPQLGELAEAAKFLDLPQPVSVSPHE